MRSGRAKSGYQLGLWVGFGKYVRKLSLPATSSQAKKSVTASARGLITVMYSPGSPYDVFVNTNLVAPFTHYAAWAFSDGSLHPMFTGLLTTGMGNHTDVLMRPSKSNLTGSGGQDLPIVRIRA